MKEIVLFDPSYGTMNIGDNIINEAVMREMGYLFYTSFLTRYSTHTPIVHIFQLMIPPNFIIRTCKNANLKFVGGSNIFKNNLLHPRWDWNVNIFTKALYKNSIIIGGGLEGSPKTVNFYTRYIYKKILSKKYIHSARDEKTRKFIEDLGFKAINTGCPTLWMLTEKHCKNIPREKSKSVVFTLTDYHRNIKDDSEVVNVLQKNYDKVYFWPQGIGDFDYLNSLSVSDNIEILSPNIESFRDILTKGNIDFVGTRLHAGIFAMQNKVRSIIISVDNRASDMQESYNINMVRRGDLTGLDTMINSNFKTSVKIDEEKIATWKAQFHK